MANPGDQGNFEVFSVDANIDTTNTVVSHGAYVDRDRAEEEAMRAINEYGAVVSWVKRRDTGRIVWQMAASQRAER